MKIDGRVIAGSELENLADRTAYWSSKGIVPTLAVILVGDDPGSLSYIKQKRIAAEKIGARLIFEHLPQEAAPETLASAVAHFNHDSKVHGLIIQRPVPRLLGDVTHILLSVAPVKDIDGFLPDSPYQVPVARAVITILRHIHADLTAKRLVTDGFMAWLTRQSIAVIGRGETAGKPVASLLGAYKCAVTVIHSHSENPDSILKSASIIISCVGKKDVIPKKSIVPGVILISVGLWRDEAGILHGDYNEADVEDIASFYTPTPGGIGPVNVASLMHNLLEATHLQYTPAR